MNKAVNIIFVSLFMAVLVIPLFFVNLVGGTVSEKENRVLAQRPAIPYFKESPGGFIKDFDTWFSDNVGFREQFIDLYDKIDNFGQKVQYTNGRYIFLNGQEGHKYFAYENGWMTSKFQGNQYLSDDQLSGMADRLSKTKNHLEEQGIPFITMFCTDKESVYPEYYPKSIKRGPEPTQLDIITEYVKSNTDVDVFNIKECFVAEKTNYLIYNKAVGDLEHYNDIGAFFAYRELMRHIDKYIPGIKSFTIDDVNISYDENDIPKVSLKQELTHKKLDPGFFDNVSVAHPSEADAFENNNMSLPKILIMRDSYMGQPLSISRYISEHFGQTVLIHYINMEHFEDYVNEFKPDIVVFEVAERELNNFSNLIMRVR